MPRSYNPTAMYRYAPMQKSGGSGFGATYALKGNGTTVYAKAAANLLLVLGDTVKVTFRNTDLAGAANKFLHDGDIAGATRGFAYNAATTSLLGYSTGNASLCELDGTPVVDLTVPFPIDGLTHTVELTASAAMTIRNLFTSYPAITLSTATIIQLQTNTAARGIETWNFNTRSLTVIHEAGGTGVDFDLIGVTADDWVRL